MSKTKIEWTDYTWNPVTGCTQMSDGCTNCYAEKMSKRFPVTHGGNGVHFSEVVLHEDRFDLPIFKSRTPKRIFLCSMGDLFHSQVPDWYIEKVLTKIEQVPRHTFQILTKRILRTPHFYFPSNVWLGVTVEDDLHWWRQRHLFDSRAKITFISCEPLLGEIKIYLALIG